MLEAVFVKANTEDGTSQDVFLLNRWVWVFVSVTSAKTTIHMVVIVAELNEMEKKHGT